MSHAHNRHRICISPEGTASVAQRNVCADSCQGQPGCSLGFKEKKREEELNDRKQE